MNNRTTLHLPDTAQRRTGSKKYRPVLPAHLIEHILALAKSENPISASSIEVVGILAPFQAKIQNDSLTPAYTTKPKQSLEEKLGMVPGTIISYSLDGIDYRDKVDYWRACYNKYVAMPTTCSLAEIQAAQEHMYLHGLMSDEEVAVFEAGK